jgi:hypothetical protein
MVQLTKAVAHPTNGVPETENNNKGRTDLKKELAQALSGRTRVGRSCCFCLTSRR